MHLKGSQGVKSPFDSFAFSAALIDQSVMRRIGQENGMKRPEDIIPTFPEWPRQWMGLQEDVPYGQGLIKVMRPFVEHLIASAQIPGTQIPGT